MSPNPITVVFILTGLVLSGRPDAKDYLFQNLVVSEMLL